MKTKNLIKTKKIMKAILFILILNVSFAQNESKETKLKLLKDTIKVILENKFNYKLTLDSLMRDYAIYYAKEDYFNNNELSEPKIRPAYSKKLDISMDFITNLELNEIINLVSSSLDRSKEDSKIREFFTFFKGSKYWIEYIEIKERYILIISLR